MTVYAYIRISCDKQNMKNQRYEILKFADEKNLRVDEWVQETVSGKKTAAERRLGVLLEHLTKNDVLIVSELSRLGRSVMEVMSILHDCMKREAKIFTTKERYELGNNISSKVLAFAFGLSAEIERNMISQRTKEALARLKSEGKTLGRPKGMLWKKTKLTGREKEIQEFLRKRIAVAAIARLLGVHRQTLTNFIKTRKLKAAL
jgi:DNA invertase Pin-like site-specific DNA recombinase